MLFFTRIKLVVHLLEKTVIGGLGAKDIKTFTICNLKLVWCSILERKNLKLSNKNYYCNFKYGKLCVPVSS